MAGPPRYIPPDVMARRTAEYEAPTSRYQIDRLMEKHHAEDLERERQERAEAVELRELRQRVAQLERRLSKVVNSRGDLSEHLVAVMGKVVGHVRGEVADLSKAIRKRVDALEAKPAGNMRYAGVWSDAKEYVAGSVASHKGAAWIATIDSRGLTPGDGAGWTLMAKSDLADLRRTVRDEVSKRIGERPAVR